MSTLDNVHKQVLNSILRQDHNNPGQPQQGGGGGQENPIAQKDAALRQAVSDLYIALSEQAPPEQAVDMLAEHVAMMVEMINEFKAKK